MPAQTTQTTANNTNNLNNEKQRQQHRFRHQHQHQHQQHQHHLLPWQIVHGRESWSTVSEYPGQEGVRAITIKLVDEDHTRHLSRQIIRGGFCLNPMSLPSQYSKKKSSMMFFNGFAGFTQVCPVFQPFWSILGFHLVGKLTKWGASYRFICLSTVMVWLWTLAANILAAFAGGVWLGWSLL